MTTTNWKYGLALSQQTRGNEFGELLSNIHYKEEREKKDKC